MRPAPRATTVLVAALMAGALAGCGPGDPDPTSESGTPTPTTSSSTSPTPSPTSSPSPTTAEGKAYASAETAYRKWLAAYIKAKKTFDASKLDQRNGTAALNAAIKKDFNGFLAADKKNGTKTIGTFTEDIKEIKGSKYVKGQAAQLSVCAVINSRFIDETGKDVTLDGPNGKPAPINTTPRQFQIQFTTPDGGKTWQTNSFVQGDTVGAQC